MRLGQSVEAEAQMRKALALDPGYGDAANNLSILLMGRKAYEDAEPLLRGAIGNDINHFSLHINLGDLLTNTGRLPEALYYFRRAVEMDPKSGFAKERLARPLIDLHKITEAMSLLETALNEDPSIATGWVNLGRCHLVRGNIADADRCNQTALEKDPDLLAAWMNLVFAANYLQKPRRDVFELHLAAASRLLKKNATHRFSSHGNKPLVDRRLRIGFVSGDLRRHSVSYFIEGPVAQLNKENFETWAYFNYRAEDYRSEELKPLFHKWQNIFGQRDIDVAELIRRDEIDILVDLSGYTGSNRMEVFAMQPAPIQVSWIGYANTTGMETIAYRLTDALADPVDDADQFASESLVRLPAGFLCYSPPTEAPTPAPRSLRPPGHVRFGSFNARTKIGVQTMALWKKVLDHIPESTLTIKSGVGLNDQIGRDTLLDALTRFGLPRERISVLGFVDSATAHMAAYDSIDICLDTVPYNGTTTTCEALWMGVPVVTLIGDRHASRVGLSLLTHAGLAELVASDEAEYLEIAKGLAYAPEHLLSLHTSLRKRLEGSSLLDPKGMARNIEQAFRSMWSRWCADHAQQTTDSLVADPAAARWAETSAGAMRLNIGGTKRKDGWKILNVTPGPDVDFLGDIRNLDEFESGSCQEIYASHVIEHVDQNQIVNTLRGLHRLLIPGGRLYISVPDLSVLCHQFLNPRFDQPERYHVMRMIFGGQTDSHDYHQIGLSLEFMADFLGKAGFYSVEQVEAFNLFNDTSTFAPYGTPISLNLIAIK